MEYVSNRTLRGAGVPLVVLAALLAASGGLSAQETPAPKSTEERLAELEKKFSELEKSQADPLSLRAYWRDGVMLESADKKFRVRFGGRIHVDATLRTAEDELDDAFSSDPSADGVDMRRARFYMDGQIYEDFGWRSEIEFAGGSISGNSNSAVALTDVYMRVSNLPGKGTLQVGHQYEPYGLEELTSDNYISFIERGPTSAFNPGRNTGIRYHGSCGQATVFHWAGGVFRATNGTGDDTGVDHAYNFTGRSAASMLYEENKEKKTVRFLHLGAAVSDSLTDGETVTYSQKPVTNFDPNFVTTGAMPTQNVVLAGFEGAYVCGPFSLQAEWNQSAVQRTGAAGANDNPDFFAWYAYASWFLTGESRAYNRADALFTRVRPHRNFGVKNRTGPGAWEMLVRVDEVDLSSQGVQGGELIDYTFGTNWYWNPNVRVMVNLIHSHLDGAFGVKGTTRQFLMRFAIDF